MYNTFNDNQQDKKTKLITSGPATSPKLKIEPNLLNDDDPFKIDFNESEWLKCCGIKISLTLATIIAAIIGGVIGVIISLNTTLSDNSYKIIMLIGDIWLNALKVLVLPLLSLMMIVLPSRMDQVESVAKQCIPLYIFTSFIATIEGTLWVQIIKPGEFGQSYIKNGDNDDNDDPINSLQPISEMDAFLNVFYGIIPENIITAMSELQVFGIIVFFLIFGLLLKDIPSKEKVIDFCNIILKCVMRAIVYVIWMTPFGMLSIITAQIANTDDIELLFRAIGVWLLCLIIGLSVHLMIFYPFLLWISTRSLHNIFYGFKFLILIFEAPLMAFITSSSAATLPKSLQVATNKANIRSKFAQFVLPLGSAINMDGGALYYPIAIGFIAQLHDETLSLSVIVVICLLSVTVSVGTAPIPIGASIVYILMLLKAAGLQEYETEAIGTLFIFEWFCDRIRTAVNVGSDLFIAKISDDVHKIAKKKNKNIICGCCYKKKSKQTMKIVYNDNDQLIDKNAPKTDIETRSWLEIADQ